MKMKKGVESFGWLKMRRGGVESVVARLQEAWRAAEGSRIAAANQARNQNFEALIHGGAVGIERHKTRGIKS